MATETTNKRNNVLFFDDDHFTVESLTFHLELLGWNVKFVSEIDNLFYELSDDHQYDILILDIVAPLPEVEKCKYVHFEEQEIDEMDDGMLTGVVLAKKIWKIKRFKDTPVLFHSARSNPIKGDKVLQNSKCVFVSKPQFAKDIDKELRAMLNQ